MNILTEKTNRIQSFNRNGTILRSKYAPEAVEIVLNLFGIRKNYLSYKLVNGKRSGPPITISDKSLKTFKGRKPPRFLTDQMIINAMEGSIDYMYGVGFGQSYCDEEGKWHNYDINYGLIDLDYKLSRELDYYSNPQPVIDAFAKYGIKVHVTESSKSGKHCYFFLDFAVPPQSMARVMNYICREEKLKVKSGLLELYPNVKAKKGSLYRAHRLPCQPGTSHNIEEFAKLVLEGKSEITVEEFDALLQKSFKRNANKEKYLELINKGWIGCGQTYHLTLNIAIYHRIFGEYETKKELHDLCVQFAKEAPGYKKYCGHQHEIEDIFWSKINEVWVNNYKYESAKRYTKKSKLEQERLPKIKQMLAEGKSINAIAKELKASWSTIKKQIDSDCELSRTYNKRVHFLNDTASQNNKDKNAAPSAKKVHTNLLLNSHIHFYYPKDKVNSICENSRTPNNGVHFLKMIEKLNEEELKSTLAANGNVKVKALATKLGCHRNSLLKYIGTKDEITNLVNTLLNKNNNSNTPNTPNTPNTLEISQITPGKSSNDKRPLDVKTKANKANYEEVTSTCNNKYEKAVEELIKNHWDEYDRKVAECYKNGDINTAERISKEYEVLTLPDGSQIMPQYTHNR